MSVALWSKAMGKTEYSYTWILDPGHLLCPTGTDGLRKNSGVNPKTEATEKGLTFTEAASGVLLSIPQFTL